MAPPLPREFIGFAMWGHYGHCQASLNKPLKFSKHHKQRPVLGLDRWVLPMQQTPCSGIICSRLTCHSVTCTRGIHTGYPRHLNSVDVHNLGAGLASTVVQVLTVNSLLLRPSPGPFQLGNLVSVRKPLFSRETFPRQLTFVSVQQAGTGQCCSEWQPGIGPSQSST